MADTNDILARNLRTISKTEIAEHTQMAKKWDSCALMFQERKAIVHVNSTIATQPNGRPKHHW